MSDETTEWLLMLAEEMGKGATCPKCATTKGEPTLGMMLGLSDCRGDLVCGWCGHRWRGAEDEVKKAVDAHCATELYCEGRHIIAAMGAGTP